MRVLLARLLLGCTVDLTVARSIKARYIRQRGTLVPYAACVINSAPMSQILLVKVVSPVIER